MKTLKFLPIQMNPVKNNFPLIDAQKRFTSLKILRSVNFPGVYSNYTLNYTLNYPYTLSYL